jgi:cytidylate kinase
MDTDLQKCHSFIQSLLQPERKRAPAVEARWRAVTVSRQSGAGGHAVAEMLAAYLQRRAPQQVPWTVFDSNLVEKVLKDHGLPERLAKFMPENHMSRVQDILDDLLGVHPPVETLVHKTAETILHLAALGNVVLVGRAANIITSRLDHVFHVRLIAPLEKRVAQMQALRRIGKAAALKFVRAEDRARRSYVRKYFRMGLDDPLLYHLIINTGWVDYGTAARIIGEAVLTGCK